MHSCDGDNLIKQSKSIVGHGPNALSYGTCWIRANSVRFTGLHLYETDIAEYVTNRGVATGGISVYIPQNQAK